MSTDGMDVEDKSILEVQSDVTGSYYWLEGTVTTGMEQPAQDECIEHMPAGTLTKYTQGHVFMRVPSDLIQQYCQRCLSLRSLDNLYFVVHDCELKVNAVDADHVLAQLTSIIGDVNWELMLCVWQYINGPWPAGIQHSLDRLKAYRDRSDQESQLPLMEGEHVPSFRVTCYRAGEQHIIQSPAAAAHFGDHVQRHFGWKVQMKKMHLEIVLRITENQVSVSIPLNNESLFKRNLVAFGPTSLRSTIAYCLVRLARPQPGDILMDPLCGTGAIPLEAALAYKHLMVTAVEINDKGMSNTSQNAEHNHKQLNGLLGLVQADSTRLCWRTGTVDCLVTDLPFGKRMGSKQGNRVLYPRLLREFARLVVPGTGRAVLLTQDAKNFHYTMRPLQHWWRMEKSTFVNVGGLHAHAYSLKRTNNVWQPDATEQAQAQVDQMGQS